MYLWPAHKRPKLLRSIGFWVSTDFAKTERAPEENSQDAWRRYAAMKTKNFANCYTEVGVSALRTP